MLTLKGHKQPVQSVAFSPDGSTLMSVDRSDNVRLWDMRTGAMRWQADEAFYTSVTYTPDGDVLTCDRAGTRPVEMNGRVRSDFDRANPVQVRDATTGAALPAAVRYDVVPPLCNLLFSPDGTRCVARGGYDSRDLLWWEYPSGRPLPTWTDAVAHEMLWFKALAFSPDGRTLAGMNSHGVTVFDATNGTMAFRHPFKLVQDECRLAFHPDGRRLAVGSGTRMAILDLDGRTEVAAVTQAKKYFLNAAFTPDGRSLATVSNEETVKFWDVASGQMTGEYAWQVGGLRRPAFAPDGLTAAAGGMGRKVVVWDVDG